jgi:CRP/FNR family cyclic AMP-dependent transcriptional regulator
VVIENNLRNAHGETTLASNKTKTASWFLPGAEALRAITAKAVTRTFPKNAIILNEGDRADSLYVILEGCVKVFVANAEGKEVVLSTQGPGEYFGEMILDEGPRSASVITLEPSRFLVVPKADFKRFLLDNPRFAVRLIEDLIRRVRSLTENVKSLALMDVYGRVARVLLELAEECDGNMVITSKLTQQDIASRVGASREMISKILKDLSVGGYITVEHKHITINKAPPRHW